MSVYQLERVRQSGAHSSHRAAVPLPSTARAVTWPHQGRHILAAGKPLTRRALRLGLRGTKLSPG